MSAMEPLLYLSQRLPYPPNKGDKITTFNFLKHLRERFRIHLACFVDDERDWEHVETVRSYCESLHVARFDKFAGRLRALRALASSAPWSLAYFRDEALTRWVHETVEKHGISRVLAYSSGMVQYVPEPLVGGAVLHFADVDSDKWRRYSLAKPWPLSAVYGREARQLLRYERQVAEKAMATTFVTEAEAQLFRSLAPECSVKVGVVENGVDAEYFSPQPQLASPYRSGAVALVFTGAMDYWPNVDAVCWFARHCLPALRARVPAIEFFIVGMNPAKAVRDLEFQPGITVTGRVADVRAYVQFAAAAIVPLRIARGIQNKVLEGMAMARPVITTPGCAEVLTARVGEEILTADTPEEWISTTMSCLGPDRANAIGAAARQRVVDDYSWTASLAKLSSLLGEQALDQTARPQVPVSAVINRSAAVTSVS